MRPLCLAVLLGGLAVCACGVARSGRPFSLHDDLVFIARDGCVNTPDLATNLLDALNALHWPTDFQVVQAESLAPTDPRSGYPTPTLLYRGHDLFGMPEPTPPYPEPT